MNIIEAFMNVYMYELEKELQKHKEKLSQISFQSDEANTDRPLKEYLRDFIKMNFNKIPDNSTINTISLGNKVQFTDTNIELKSIKIDRVLLPEDITQDIKDELSKNRKSIFTNPDLCLEINYKNNRYFQTIELKSTKNNSIPGSSIQQIKPEEWVIFIKHTSTTIEISTGQYINAINAKMEFPDRSPRPQVSFSELQKWNIKNRKLSQNELTYNIDDKYFKKELLCDWQKVLVDNWIDVLFDFEPTRNPTWFNNTLRKFIIEFLYKYDNLSENEKTKYKENVKKNIK